MILLYNASTPMISRFLLLSPYFLQKAIWPVTKVLFSYFIKLQVHGLQNIDSLGPGVVFVSNHSSELDPIIVPASFPFFSKHFPMFYASRPRNFYIHSSWRKLFYGGLIFKIWGAHAVEKGQRDYALALKSHIDILSYKRSLLIFPEGRKTRTGLVDVSNSKGGAVYAAKQTNLPIVPIVIQGLYKMTCREFITRKRNVTVTFGQPIFAQDIISAHFSPEFEGDNEYKGAIRKVMQDISDKLSKSPYPAYPAHHPESLVR